jgi:hypothetical protein
MILLEKVTPIKRETPRKSHSNEAFNASKKFKQ